MSKQAVGGQALIEGVMMQSKEKRAIAVRKADGEIVIKKNKIKSWINDKNIDKIPGQALIEGVMMQSKEKRAIAVRKADGEIVIKKNKIKSWINDKNIDKIPFVRGSFILIENMIEGINSLNYSSEFFMDEEDEEEDKFDILIKKIFKHKANDVVLGIAMVFAILISIGMFVLTPTFIGGLFSKIISNKVILNLIEGIIRILILFTYIVIISKNKDIERTFQYHGAELFSKIISNKVILNLIEGIIRILILFTYIVIISKNKDIERTFQYHGAEHKAVYCYENNLELTIENARKFTTLHPRCGTNFLFIVMSTSIILFSFFGWPNPLARVIMRIVCIPVVAGISYEIIRFLGKYNNKLTKIVAYPGMMLQKFTTKEPDDSQLEVALAALKAVVN